jgi:hypothetical protein
MFKLEPITTTNIISIVQILVVVAGFYFSWRSLEATRRNLELATANAQAQLFNQLLNEARDLQYKFMEIYHGSNTEADTKAKQDQFIGTVISYYAACYSLRSILVLPPTVTRLFDEELRQLMQQELYRQKWTQLSPNYAPDFVDHVNKLRRG